MAVQKNIQKHIIKIVDTEGNILATYQQTMTDQLGFALACYTAGSERFTFVTPSDAGIFSSSLPSQDNR